jgi:hypothetical protein
MATFEPIPKQKHDLELFSKTTAFASMRMQDVCYPGITRSPASIWHSIAASRWNLNRAFPSDRLHNQSFDLRLNRIANRWFPDECRIGCNKALQGHEILTR